MSRTWIHLLGAVIWPTADPELRVGGGRQSGMQEGTGDRNCIAHGCREEASPHCLDRMRGGKSGQGGE